MQRWVPRTELGRKLKNYFSTRIVDINSICDGINCTENCRACRAKLAFTNVLSEDLWNLFSVLELEQIGSEMSPIEVDTVPSKGTKTLLFEKK